MVADGGIVPSSQRVLLDGIAHATNAGWWASFRSAEAV